MVSMDSKVARAGPTLKLFIRDVRDRQGKKRPITVRTWASVKDVKDAIQQILQVPVSTQRLYFGPLLAAGKDLPNHRTLQDAGIDRSGQVLLLDIVGRDVVDAGASIFTLQRANDICISSSMYDFTPRALRSMAQEARRGFALGLKPEFILDGSGGTYFLHDVRKNRIAVFKPADEEPYAENNPRGYLPQPGHSLSLREGIIPGEACLREVAAFLLDHDGFSGVPLTTLAEARHHTFNTNGSRLKVSEGGASVGSHALGPNSPVKPPCMAKAGSLQEFVRCECSMDDISPSMISVEEVHKIAILDIRIMNADRNAANLLVRRRQDDSLVLVPIDHGYCLRSVCDVSWMDWCWLDWPQLKQPISDRQKKYILSLDIEADSRMLHERLNLCEEAIDYFRASSALLNAGVKAGLTLYDIAIMCCRNDNLAEIPSMMEKLFSMASELAHHAVENERWHHSAASRALADQLSPLHRRLHVPSNTGSQVRMHKSASSAEFLVMNRNEYDDEAGLDIDLGSQGSPGMVQSSASSDSGAESVGDGLDCEACEEWAASIVADVSADQIHPTARRGFRSSSVTSSDDASLESNLSSSPKGFWTIRPGTAPPPVSDEGSISWSPRLSPRNSMEIQTNEPSVVLPGPVSLSKYSKSSSVKFADHLPSLGPFIPPAVVSVSPSKEGLFTVDISALQIQEGGLTRSKSYSALSNAASDKDQPFASLKRKSSSEEYGNYRKYFHKFIDLVIVRETTAALRHSRSGH